MLRLEETPLTMGDLDLEYAVIKHGIKQGIVYL